jgi:hypothetical protein
MNYERIYNAIISKSRSENRKRDKGIYYEGHHIIPKCLGGEGISSYRNHPNIILLTAKEHYICHRLLCEIYPNNNKLRIALWAMINGLGNSKKRYIPSGRIYAIIKEESIEKMSKEKLGKVRGHHSEETKKKMSEAQKGKLKSIHSEETKKKMSEAHKNRLPISEETRQKISKSSKGRIFSEETRLKMSIAQKNRAPMSKETKQKMSNKIISDEHKKKISDTAARKRASKITI